MRVPSLDAVDPKVKDAWPVKMLRLLTAAVNGALTFGDGTSPDNMAGKWMRMKTGPTPGVEFAVFHNTGYIPTGIIVMIPPPTGYINVGATPWTTTNVYLTATTANEDMTVFFPAPPRS